MEPTPSSSAQIPPSEANPPMAENPTPAPSPSKSPISLNPILTLITITSLLLTGFFTYQNWLTNQKLQQLIESQTTTPTLTSKPTPIDETNILPFITNPEPNSIISSPVTVSGNIPKSWTWEANFIIEIQNDMRIPIASTPVSAQFQNEDDEFPSFNAFLVFTPNSSTGFIVIKSDNPSGLPENDVTFSLPIFFPSAMEL